MEIYDIFKVLSDKNRNEILNIIKEHGEICACDLLKLFNITQATFSYHMKMLKDSGLVRCYKKGTWCIYSIEQEKMKDLASYFEKLGSGKCD